MGWIKTNGTLEFVMDKVSDEASKWPATENPRWKEIVLKLVNAIDELNVCDIGVPKSVSVEWHFDKISELAITWVCESRQRDGDSYGRISFETCHATKDVMTFSWVLMEHWNALSGQRSRNDLGDDTISFKNQGIIDMAAAMNISEICAEFLKLKHRFAKEEKYSE